MFWLDKQMICELQLLLKPFHAITKEQGSHEVYEIVREIEMVSDFSNVLSQEDLLLDTIRRFGEVHEQTA